MKAKHHFWSSVVVGGALSIATRSPAALAGAMVGGFLVDADHIIDHIWSIASGAPPVQKGRGGSGKRRAATDDESWWDRYGRRRKLQRLVLVFHSYELLTLTLALAAYTRNPPVVGLAAGYALHITLDLIRHHEEFRSPFFYLLSYRVFWAFRRDRLVKSEYL
ncbi:MAG TPA: hypothetical protein VJX67_21670 [Blastocatellia bacterium]|nr:hypothetical protein [Blastocatellia bacterium]